MFFISRKGGVTAFLESVNQKKDKKSADASASGDASANASVADNKENKTGSSSRGSSSLQSIVEFLNTLATNFDDSRIVIKTGPSMKGWSVIFWSFLGSGIRFRFGLNYSSPSYMSTLYSYMKSRRIAKQVTAYYVRYRYRNRYWYIGRIYLCSLQRWHSFEQSLGTFWKMFYL